MVCGAEYDLSVNLEPSTEECTEFAHDPVDATSVNEISGAQQQLQSRTRAHGFSVFA